MKVSTESRQFAGRDRGRASRIGDFLDGCPFAERGSSRPVDQPAIDLFVAFDFLVGRILPEDEVATSLPQTASKLRIANERGRALLELGLIAEEQPRVAVVDD